MVGGTKMNCPICGYDGLETGDVCPSCHIYIISPYYWPAEPTLSISDLEKIEPLNPRNVSSEYWNATHENRAKLNEVIEKVNRIMEVMNRR